MPQLSKDYCTPKEPLLQSTLPDHPWERIASDLFQLNGMTYLLVVDYYLRYVEVQKLNSTSSASVITALKAIFSRHGIPTTLVSDNGPQYDSHEMKALILQSPIASLISQVALTILKLMDRLRGW